MNRKRSIARNRRLWHRRDNGTNARKFVETIRVPYANILPTFDYYLVTDFFPAVNSTLEIDTLIKDALEQRLKEITPSSEEMQKLKQITSKIMLILDRIKLSPWIDACKIENFCVVGSLRMNTMLKGHQAADIVVVLQTLPAKAAIPALGNKILEELHRLEPAHTYQMNFNEDNLELVNAYSRDIIRILIATIPTNLNKINRNIHVRKNLVQRHLMAIKHANWIEENVKNDDILKLMRIMKDIRLRFQEFIFFSPWMVLILCHYSITRTRTNIPLPIHIAFKRILQLLSSGIFLPYSAGIIDPCEPKMPIHGKLSVYDQETITRRAQSLLRILNYHNACKYIFGLEKPQVDIAENISYWDNVVLAPSISVCEPKPGQLAQRKP